MRKEALVKDFRMEVKNSLNRFLSIFFIVALGAAFLSGVRAGEPGLQYSGDEYFDERNMMDLKVISTLGLTDDDIDAILAVDGVKEVNPGYMIDVLSMMGDSERIVHLESIPDTMNTVDIAEGRMPRNARECIIDMDAAAAYDIQIGDILEFKSGTEDGLEDTLILTEYEVVGTCSSPTYISMGRGSTNISHGEIDLFAYILGASFCQEVYSQIWITVAGAKEATAFTKEYQDIVAEVKEKIEGIADVRCDARYTEVMEEANSELEEAESELAKAKEEIEVELMEAEAELRDGEMQIADGKAKLAASQKELNNAKAELESGRVTLDDGWKEYHAGAEELEDGKEKLAQAEIEIAENEALIADGEAQIADAEVQLAMTEPILAAAEAALAEAKVWNENKTALQESYDSGILTLNDKKVTLSALQQFISSGTGTEEEIAEAQAQADALQLEITEMEVSLASTKMEIDAMTRMEPYINEVLARESEIVSGREELEAGKIELKKQKEILEDGKVQIEAGKIELEAGKQEMLEGEELLKDSYAQLMDAENQYQDGWKQISNGQAQISSGYSTIAANEQKIVDGWQELEDGRKEAEEAFLEAEIEIADAKEQVESIKKPTWYVTDREDDADYAGYAANAERMGAIGRVFPILFFLVAALVSLTTMTRMVEEQRMQIGTLKALGYSKFDIAAKFLGYALAATLGGSIVGVLIGEKAFPWIIVNAYKILYVHIPNVVIPYHMGYALLATGAALACTMGATISSCYKVLAAQPSTLMRPEAPRVGKKVLIERIPGLWKHLSFTWKSTIRNLMRYKKRFFMTVFGIGGCMALMLVGYGLKDSITDVTRLQYGTIHLYDLMAVVDEDISDEEQAELKQALDGEQHIEGYMNGHMRLTEMDFNDTKKDIYLYVPSTLNQLDQFITFNYRKTREQWHMDENSVIITEKVARDMGIEKGDSIELKLEDDRFITVEITDVCENYLAHYLYIAPQMYEKLTGHEPEYNAIYVSVAEDAMEDLETIGSEFLKNEGVLMVSYTQDTEQDLESSISVLDSVIIILIAAAGMLAFVVLYNLNNININERRRELATLKVLGFYDAEVAAYVYRENVLLTFIGVGLGCGLGKLLHGFIVKTVEVDQTMFGLTIMPKSYMLAIVFTVLFSLLVNGMMYFKLKKIDMVESLKSVE